jgi:hypothetical protein
MTEPADPSTSSFSFEILVRFCPIVCTIVCTISTVVFHRGGDVIGTCSLCTEQSLQQLVRFLPVRGIGIIYDFLETGDFGIFSGMTAVGHADPSSSRETANRVSQDGQMYRLAPGTRTT